MRPGSPAARGRGGGRARSVRLLAATALWAALCILVSSCGGVQAADLFIVYRSGSIPSGNLVLLVNEEGVVHCDGRLGRNLSSSELVKARAIQEEMHDAASKHLALAARPGSVLSYYVRDPDGSVRFADNSLGQPSVLHDLQLFVLRAAQRSCGLSQ